MHIDDKLELESNHSYSQSQGTNKFTTHSDSSMIDGKKKGKKKPISLSEKLKGKIVPIAIFMDVGKDNNSIYYLTTSKNKKALKGEDESQIQIKEYDPQ